MRTFNIKRSSKKLLAVVIELNGEMLDSALTAWNELENNLSVKFISSMSHAPHITLESNIQCEYKELSKIVSNVASRISAFSIKGNGLGVFVVDTPVVYIRWSKNNELLHLKTMLKDSLNTAYKHDEVELYNEDVNWLAKTTLAYKDSSYDKLSDILSVCRLSHFKYTMQVTELSIYEYSDEYPEKKNISYRLNLNKD